MFPPDPSRKKNPFPVRRAAELRVAPPDERWHVATLWGYQSVGIVAGCPKSAKTWYALSLAFGVASGIPVFGRFIVHQRGSALIYIAEDQESMVRVRIDALCRYHEIDINELDLKVITVPSMRLDTERDQQRLVDTVDQYPCSMLVIDPLVRIHACDENSTTEIARLLGFLRAIQRTFETALVLVHHTTKRKTERAGQSLRGSSDLWAWTDSSAYLRKKKDDEARITLTLEHRSAPAPDPLSLALVSRADGSATHLELLSDGGAEEAGAPARPRPIAERALEILRRSSPLPLRKQALRDELRVNNSRLGDALVHLEQAGCVERTTDGWRVRSEPHSDSGQQSLLPS